MPSFEEIGLKKCQYCLAEIPIEAKKCRHCGEWVASQVVTDGNKTQEIPQIGQVEEIQEKSVLAQKSPFLYWYSKIMGALNVLAAIGIVFSFSTDITFIGALIKIASIAFSAYIGISFFRYEKRLESWPITGGKIWSMLIIASGIIGLTIVPSDESGIVWVLLWFGVLNLLIHFVAGIQHDQIHLETME